MDFPSSLVSSYVGFVFHFYVKGGGVGVYFSKMIVVTCHNVSCHNFEDHSMLVCSIVPISGFTVILKWTAGWHHHVWEYTLFSVIKFWKLSNFVPLKIMRSTWNWVIYPRIHDPLKSIPCPHIQFLKISCNITSGNCWNLTDHCFWQLFISQPLFLSFIPFLPLPSSKLWSVLHINIKLWYILTLHGTVLNIQLPPVFSTWKVHVSMLFAPDGQSIVIHHTNTRAHLCIYPMYA